MGIGAKAVVAYHVFADSLCLTLGQSSDLAADVETCVAPAENFPLAPLLPAFGMTRWTKSACLAGKHQQALFSTVLAPDAGKSAHRIAAVEILLYNILDHRPEIAVLLLEPILIFSKELLEIIKKHPIKNGVFRMTLAVDLCHGREDDSRNGPDCGKRLCSPDVPGMYASANLLKSVNKR